MSKVNESELSKDLWTSIALALDNSSINLLSFGRMKSNLLSLVNFLMGLVFSFTGIGQVGPPGGPAKLPLAPELLLIPLKAKGGVGMPVFSSLNFGRGIIFMGLLLVSHLPAQAQLKRSSEQMPPTGYYFSSSVPFGHFFPQIPNVHRLAHVDLYGANLDQHIAIAEEAQNRQLRIIYGAHEIAFGYNSAQNRYVLRADWRQRWEATLPLIAEFTKRGAFHSVYLADEPYSHGLTNQEMDTVTNWLHDRGLRVMVVEHAPHARSPRPDYDFFGLTCYSQNASGEWFVDWNYCESQSIKGRANIIVGQSFQSEGFPIPEQRPAVTLAKKLRAKAVLWFLWPTAPHGNLFGASSDPSIIEQHKRMHPKFILNRRPTKRLLGLAVGDTEATPLMQIRSDLRPGE